MDRLPTFRYSLDAPGHLLPTKQELNKIIRDNIYRQYIQVTWIAPPGGLSPKLAFYAEHFMALRDDLIVRPSYTHRHWMRALKIPLGQFWVGSHWLRVEAEYHIPRWTGPTNSAIFKRPWSRPRSTSYSVSPSTMRSKDSTTTFSGILGTPFPSCSSIRTSDLLPCSWRMPSDSDLNHFDHPPDRTLPGWSHL